MPNELPREEILAVILRKALKKNIKNTFFKTNMNDSIEKNLFD